MVVKDLSNSFYPCPKNGLKTKIKQNNTVKKVAKKRKYKSK